MDYWSLENEGNLIFLLNDFNKASWVIDNNRFRFISFMYHKSKISRANSKM